MTQCDEAELHVVLSYHFLPQSEVLTYSLVSSPDYTLSVWQPPQYQMNVWILMNVAKLGDLSFNRETNIG